MLRAVRLEDSDMAIKLSAQSAASVPMSPPAPADFR